MTSHMKTPAFVLTALVAATTLAGTANAAPSNAALQKQVKALRAQVKAQQTAINKRNATIRTLTSEVTALRASASATITARIATMTPDEVWSILPSLYARFPDSDGTWSRSYNNYSGWESYTFSHTP